MLTDSSECLLKTKLEEFHFIKKYYYSIVVQKTPNTQSLPKYPEEDLPKKPNKQKKKKPHHTNKNQQKPTNKQTNK